MSPEIGHPELASVQYPGSSIPGLGPFRQLAALEPSRAKELIAAAFDVCMERGEHSQMVKSLYADFMVQSLAHIADQGATDDQRQEQLLAWARVP